MNRARRRCMDAAIRREARGCIRTRPTSPAQDDARWFQRNADRSYRVRRRLSDEWFASPKDVPDLDMVAVRQIKAGIRVRVPFKIPVSPCAAHVRETAATEHGAAILFDLASRRLDCRCDILMALLDRQPTPDGRTR